MTLSFTQFKFGYRIGLTFDIAGLYLLNQNRVLYLKF